MLVKSKTKIVFIHPDIMLLFAESKSEKPISL